MNNNERADLFLKQLDDALYNNNVLPRNQQAYSDTYITIDSDIVVYWYKNIIAILHNHGDTIIIRIPSVSDMRGEQIAKINMILRHYALPSIKHSTIIGFYYRDIPSKKQIALDSSIIAPYMAINERTFRLEKS